MTSQQLFRAPAKEARRERSCYVCHGIQALCTDSVCPIKLKARTLIALNKALDSTSLYGASPPAVFVGQHGYPRVSLGPLIPPIADQDTSIMDSPENWLNMDMGTLIEQRISLFRTKSPLATSSAKNPPKVLETVQELVMSAAPVDTEVWFTKRPRLDILISPRGAPVGPSAKIARLSLAQNPHIPKQVDKVVSDSHVPAELGAVRLYKEGIPQKQIMRILSVGLLGVGERRRLVPTEWSITAVDDMLGKALRREVLSYPKISEYLVFGHRALANNVQVLMLPTAWMYEGLEAWLASPNPQPFSDYEHTMGRKTYPRNLMGAYHAARLPVLEYLQRIRRQAGAIVLMEVEPEWVPLGVWRFREICREALKKTPTRFSTLEQALAELGRRLRLPLASWVKQSHLIRYQKEQYGLERFLERTGSS